MKKLLYMAVAAIAVLSSCNKNDALLDDNGNGVSNADAPVFTATIEGGGETKTQLVEGTTAGNLTKVNWENADEVSVNGIVYSVAPDAENATKATLTKKNSTDASPEPTFKAYYPASMYSAGTATLGGVN